MPEQHMARGEGAPIGTYQYDSKDIPITITVRKNPGDFVPTYEVSIASISKTTDFILERIRMELIKQVNLGIIDLIETKKSEQVEQKFLDTIKTLVEKYFPDQDALTRGFLTSYLSMKALGLGTIEILMDDRQLEEIVINQASEPVWVYHKQYGWLRSTIFLRDEEQIRHYASIIGRRVGRQITVLEPLLDASLSKGDRVNATLSPISTNGNTMTIRKFSRDPWTITRLVKMGTISPEAASWLWMAIHYEMSCIVAGGTASGKTSALNCFANFFPPNQRIISIEDTREIQLPSFLHWVPMNTRQANAEGKGKVAMGDLLVNSLRMRPDRIIVGEVRRKQEAETLFEAIHTGHSVYATFHANTAEEAIDRLTNPPIEVPPIMLPAISLIIVQFRNRRTGKRRTFQIAEITKDSKANVLLQYDSKKDVLVKEKRSSQFMDTLRLFTGYSDADIYRELKEKQQVIEYLVKQDVLDVDTVGRIIGEYYTDKDHLMGFVRQNKPFIPITPRKEEPAQPAAPDATPQSSPAAPTVVPTSAPGRSSTSTAPSAKVAPNASPLADTHKVPPALPNDARKQR
jgi:flagellar protein FlaI